MRYSIRDIAAAVGAEAFGDLDIMVQAVREPGDAGPDDLALATNEKYADGLRNGAARAAMVWQGADWQGMGLAAAICAPRPRFAMASLTALMDPGQGFGAGIHPTAFVDPTARVAPDLNLGANSVIGPGAQIGKGATIGPLCYIGADVVIGDNAYLRESVSIGARVTIGNRFIAQPGARIGSDGFSFVTPEPSGAEKARETLGASGTETAQSWARIHSLGSVSIGDDVEIGSCACIDRGTIRDTKIGNGTKIDNLVQIGHNCEIGRDCLICGQTGMAGSVRVGNNVVLAGQTGVADNLFIGDNVICGGSTKVMSNVPAGRVMLGYPAVKMENHVESYKALRRLPKLFRDFKELQKAVFKGDATD
jgi:UDP-3-O-[3-hydroxymyristoyl] glucosamine N-acyltransferase